MIAASGGDQRRSDPLVKDEVGDQPDQSQQRPGHDGAECPDRRREGRDDQHPTSRREVAQVAQGVRAAAHPRQHIVTRSKLTL